MCVDHLGQQGHWSAIKHCKIHTIGGTRDDPPIHKLWRERDHHTVCLHQIRPPGTAWLWGHEGHMTRVTAKQQLQWMSHHKLTHVYKKLIIQSNKMCLMNEWLSCSSCVWGGSAGRQKELCNNCHNYIHASVEDILPQGDDLPNTYNNTFITVQYILNIVFTTVILQPLHSF